MPRGSSHATCGCERANEDVAMLGYWCCGPTRSSNIIVSFFAPVHCLNTNMRGRIGAASSYTRSCTAVYAWFDSNVNFQLLLV